MPPPFLLAVAAALGLSYALTGWLRAYALSQGIVATPNPRGSHNRPTPTGGGLSFVLVFLGTVLALTFLLPMNRELWLALLGGGVVALVGWLDDRRGLSVRVRFFAHTLGALWAVVWLGGLAQLQLGTSSVSLGLFGSLLAVTGIVWSINLYNFMDGIDGLAGSQAVIVAAAAGGFLFVAGAYQVSLACWVLAAAAGGFLFWNWPNAKIFMGDVGSGTLGFVFAVLAVHTENQGVTPLLVWVILLSPFIVDATATLIRRFKQREKWYEAHRTHAYQRATQFGYSHLEVTATVLLIDLGLVALSHLALQRTQFLLPIVLVVLLALFLLWQRFARSA